jgi:hypothetical protein
MTDAEAIRQLDDVLERFEKVREKWETSYRGPHDTQTLIFIEAPHEVDAEIITALTATISRLAPTGLAYAEAALQGISDTNEDKRIKALVGAVRSLRHDYATGRLKTFREMVRSDIFSDFLEMAEYLLNDEGLKDPAAVMAGSVLEQHIRKLCDKHGVPATFTDTKGDTRPKKLDTMNADLAKARVYGGNDAKQVTAWAAIRNDAAHGHYDKYVKEQVVLMVQGIRNFIARIPA